MSKKIIVCDARKVAPKKRNGMRKLGEQLVGGFASLCCVNSAVVATVVDSGVLHWVGVGGFAVAGSFAFMWFFEKPLKKALKRFDEAFSRWFVKFCKY